MKSRLFKENNLIRWKQLEWHLDDMRPHNQRQADPPKKKHCSLRKKSELQKEATPLALQSKETFGKVTDCGYDAFSCCWTELPADYDVTIQVSILVKSFSEEFVPTGQEAFGLFLRDTMEMELFTGMPYSNMVALGAWKGCWNVFGRCGVSNSDHGHIQNFYVNDRQNAIEESSDKLIHKDPLRLRKQERLIHLVLQRTSSQFRVALQDDDGIDLLRPDDLQEAAVRPNSNIPVLSKDGRYVVDVKEDPLTSRDGKRMYLGFLSTRGSEIVILKETFSLSVGQKRQTAILSGSEIPIEDPFCEDSSESAENDSIPETTSVIWADPDGTPSGDGTFNAPFDLISAIHNSVPNTEIRLRAGTYQPEQSVILGEDGAASQGRMRFVADPTAEIAPTIDFNDRAHSLCIKGNHWELERIRVTGGMGIRIEGNHNHLKQCEAFRNLETGILIRHEDNDSPRREWPSFNLIEDCISRENCDPSEKNADGFACKVAAGPGNRFIRCISYLNSDDGFDLFAKNRKIGAVLLQQCESYLNGYIIDADGKAIPSRGNGNGFKLGGSGENVQHVTQDCIAQGNRGQGFTNNSNPYMKLISCAGHDNGKGDSYYYVCGHDPDSVQEILDCSFGPTEDFDIDLFCREVRRQFGET